ncbi:MAG: TcfC E-set like domain-containing protein [Alphaproteobacteria bacterium]|nr:TcfC E-set like domain-containing protein [Alphaproteobacteria bacterium]
MMGIACATASAAALLPPPVVQPVKAVPPDTAVAEKKAEEVKDTVKVNDNKGDVYSIQLGSYRDSVALEKDWQGLKKKYPDLLGKLTLKTVKVDLPAKGIYYRLQAGTVTASRALEICDALQNIPDGCLLVAPESGSRASEAPKAAAALPPPPPVAQPFSGPAVQPAPPPPVQPAVPLPPQSAVAPPAAASDGEGEFIAFDLIVGGNYYGFVYGRFGADWFELDQVNDALNQLPSVRNKQDFAPLFSGRLTGTKTVPEVGTIMLDTDHFAIRLEIAEAETLLQEVGGVGELEEGERGFSIRNALFAAGSTPTEKLELSSGVSVSHNTTFSKEKTAFLSSGSITAGSGYLLSGAMARHDFKKMGQDLTAYGGLLEVEHGMKFAKSLPYYGMRLESNRELLFRDSQLQGSGIEVFLPRRAQVEVFKNGEGKGQVIFSRVLDFGTMQLDTRSFPAGSYDVEIVVKDDAGVISRETRAFTKTQRLTPRGKSYFVIDAGEMRNNLQTAGVSVAQASYRRRLTDSMDGSLAAAVTSDDQVLEGALLRQDGFSVFGNLGQIDTSLTGSLSARAKPAGVEASVAWIGEKKSFGVTASQIYDRPEVAGKLGSLALSDRKALSFNFALPLEFPYINTISSSFRAEFSEDKSGGSQHRYGPAFTYKFDRYREYLPELRLEYVVTDSEEQVLGAFAIRSDTVGSAWTKTLEIAGRAANKDNETSSRATLGFSGGGFARQDWRRNLTAHASFIASPLTADQGTYTPLVTGTAKYTAQALQTQLYLDQHLKQDRQGTLGGELSTTQLWSPGAGLSATAERVSPDAALAMIRVNGKGKASVGIAVDGTLRSVVKIGETAVVSIPAFKKSKISIFNKDELADFDIRERGYSVVGYPGNVLYREFTVMKVYFLLGTLLDETGKPLAGFRFTFGDQVYYTDDRGFFTLETSLEAGQKIEIAEGGVSCMVAIPASLPEDSPTIELGKIACVKKP